MARTTSTEVIAILTPGKDYDTVNSPSLSMFIATATALVDDLSQYATDNSITVSAGRLGIIEGWLAAHAYATSDRPSATRATDQAKDWFQGKTDMGLKATHYGQMAIDLDPTGYLVSISDQEARSTKMAGYWLGRRPSVQTPYDSRS